MLNSGVTSEEDQCVEKYIRMVRMRPGPSGAVRYIYYIWFKVIHEIYIRRAPIGWAVWEPANQEPSSCVAAVGAHSWDRGPQRDSTTQSLTTQNKVTKISAHQFVFSFKNSTNWAVTYV